MDHVSHVVRKQLSNDKIYKAVGLHAMAYEILDQRYESFSIKTIDVLEFVEDLDDVTYADAELFAMMCILK